MKLVLIIGNSAVGKMTVGQELMKKTKLRLFHNHMMIEPVIEIFGEYKPDTIIKLRNVVFEEFAKSDKYGLIFTYMWAFDLKEDWNYINNVVDIFKQYNSDIYCVELIADQKTRLERNITENRLKNKASKRDIEASNARVINYDNNYRLVSNIGELPFENYLRIDNTNLSPEEVVDLIIKNFNL